MGLLWFPVFVLRELDEIWENILLVVSRYYFPLRNLSTCLIIIMCVFGMKIDILFLLYPLWGFVCVYFGWSFGLNMLRFVLGVC